MEDIPPCTICLETCKDPYALKCKHVFCTDCIIEWLKNADTCPICRSNIIDGESSTDKYGTPSRTPVSTAQPLANPQISPEFCNGCALALVVSFDNNPVPENLNPYDLAYCYRERARHIPKCRNTGCYNYSRLLAVRTNERERQRIRDAERERQRIRYTERERMSDEEALSVRVRDAEVERERRRYLQRLSLRSSHNSAEPTQNMEDDPLIVSGDYYMIEELEHERNDI